jgi:ribonucleoside-triphosphate reductase
MPGVSEGIHPIFSKYFKRRVRFSMGDPDQMQQVDDLEALGYHVEEDVSAPNTLVVTMPTKDTLVQAVVDRGWDEDIVEAADDLTLNELLAFQAMYQTCWADNAVSFTANVDPDKYTAADVAEQLVKFGGLLKGATIFPEASFVQAPYTRITKEEYEAAEAKTIEDSVDLDCATGACPVR